jgi:hypothetical protein
MMNEGIMAGLPWCFRIPFSSFLLFKNFELRCHVKDFGL